LVSSRHTSTIFKINGKTGEVVWRLGGSLSNFTLGQDVRFGFQHHARFISESDDGQDTVISIFDNSVYGSEDDVDRQIWIYPYSRAKTIRLNTRTWTASLVQQFIPPHNISAKSQGSYQILPNGNGFVNWGSEGQITEFAEDGRVLFHAYLDSGKLGSGIHNYRGFKHNWTGIPSEDPAIVSLIDGDDTNIYVSWNGDTETTSWRFYGSGEAFNTVKLLGDVQKEGFETVLNLRSMQLFAIWAEAISSNGSILTQTRPIRSQLELPAPGASEPETLTWVNPRPHNNLGFLTEL
jgi:hypothetical protein